MKYLRQCACFLLAATAALSQEHAEKARPGAVKNPSPPAAAAEEPPSSNPKGASRQKRKQKRSGPSRLLPPEKITVPEGFEVDLLYTVPKKEQGSWVSLTKDDQGRFLASDQKKQGLFRITVGGDDKVAVEKQPVPISGAQGMEWAFGSLFFHKNGDGLCKITDSNGDGKLDKAEKLPSVIGSGEHGNHDVLLTPDGGKLFVNTGNKMRLPQKLSGSRLSGWREDLLLPRWSDARGHARGLLAPGGNVVIFDPEAKTSEVFCVGFRNQYGIALNRDGELFTCDADMEWDMGSHWYRPTRICHVVSGGDYGWRNGTGKWPAYYEDSLPSVVDIGPGSPTGVISGAETAFPTRWRDALFALDWTFGTIYAIRLTPKGAGYTGKSEPFLYGAPLPVTEAAVGDDGHLYFTVGGRGMQSGLYRVRYTGSESTALSEPVEAGEAVEARKLRRKLEAFHGKEDAAALDAAWPHLGSGDRFLRHAARVAVESQPAASWADRVYGEPDPQARIAAAVALARCGTEAHRSRLLAALHELDLAALSEPQALGLLRAYALTFIRLGKPSEVERQAAAAKLNPSLPSKSADLNTELLRVLVHLRAPEVVKKGLDLIVNRSKPEPPDWAELAERNARYGGPVKKMLRNYPPSREIYYALMLSNLKEGWTLEQRRSYFQFPNQAAKGSGGASFPGFLSNIRTQALSLCSDEERLALKDVTQEDFNPKPNFPITPPKGPGRQWTVEEGMKFANAKKANFKNGRSLYFAVGCGACHRHAGLGGGVGPDLTSTPNKFSAEYVLGAILHPSKDISDQYGSSIVTLNNGKTLNGIAIEKGDVVDVYSQDPEAAPTQLSHSDIESIQPSPVSQMPPGLINGLNPKELRDLMAYIMAGGNPKDKRYK